VFRCLFRIDVLGFVDFSEEVLAGFFDFGCVGGDLFAGEGIDTNP
jgi:hypothetical protein